MCAMGALFSSRSGTVAVTKVPPVWYYERARAMGMECAERLSIEHLQALMLLFGYSTRMGARMAMLRDLNVDPDDIEVNTGIKMPWTEKETRRRIWNAIYTRDNVMATMLIRSPNLSPPTVKPVCTEELWESLADSDLLQEEYLNPPKQGFESPSNSFHELVNLFRKVFILGYCRAKTPWVSDEPMQSYEEESRTIVALQGELDDYFGRLPEGVRMLSRSTALYLLDLQSSDANEFRRRVSSSWDMGVLLPWREPVLGKYILA
ncbi:hypothetical protein HDU76_012574 [Blyttiomyces sp. JEL0837]|nr:hypothetical protein HDU76_012574 [Blyttiomyces sp. JEL0837]